MKARFALVAIVLVAAPAGASAATGEVVDLPVAFDVVNTNTSKVPCLTDGKSYMIRGRLVGPPAALAPGPRAVTVLLHGVDAVGYLQLSRFPDLDLAGGLAARGHVTVTLDRLGYGDSDRPPGASSCLGGARRYHTPGDRASARG